MGKKSAEESAWERRSFAKEAAEAQHRRYAFLEGFWTFTETLENVLQLLDYPDTLLEGSFGDFLQFMLSTFESEEALKEETNRKLWNSIINAGDERPDNK